MTRTILVSGTTLIVGFLVGAATGATLAKKQPKEKEYVEVIREVQAVAVPQPLTPREPDAEPPKPWKPKPGEMCTIVMPDEAGITNKTWKAVWVIPTDMAALVDHMDYLRARDGAGPMNLVRAHRAVWTDDRGMRDVKYIAEGAVPGAAKVRLGTGAYKADSDGGMSKDLGYQAPGVEAMISLFWLVKQD